MKFLVFRRADSALVVVPSMFQPPLACGGPHELQAVGHCYLDLDAFSASAITELGIHGFALIDGADLVMLHAHLQPRPTLSAEAAAEPDGPPSERSAARLVP
jgi:hypothetical protein